MTKKQTYTAPEADLLVIRFEENIMSAKYGTAGHAGDSVDEDFEYNL